jgi:hypothetical protein
MPRRDGQARRRDLSAARTPPGPDARGEGRSRAARAAPTPQRQRNDATRVPRASAPAGQRVRREGVCPHRGPYPAPDPAPRVDGRTRPHMPPV